LREITKQTFYGVVIGAWEKRERKFEWIHVNYALEYTLYLL